jgi:hypothetical protein
LATASSKSTNGRGAEEALAYRYALTDFTAYGRQEPQEYSSCGLAKPLASNQSLLPF